MLKIISLVILSLTVVFKYTEVNAQSNSAPLQATNGFWQEVTLKDGTKMSFAELMKKQGKEKDDVLSQLGRVDKIKFAEYELQVANQEADQARVQKQLANQRIGVKKEVEQVANQEADQARVRKQLAINEIAKKVPEIVGGMEKLLARWQKLDDKSKNVLSIILSYGKPPEWMERAKKLLNNPQNFAYNDDSAPKK